MILKSNMLFKSLETSFYLCLRVPNLMNYLFVLIKVLRKKRLKILNSTLSLTTYSEYAGAIFAFYLLLIICEMS